MFSQIDDCLINVDSPERYIGQEWNQIVKDWSNIDYKICLGFPDTYEIGMSHLGLKIIYHMLNEENNLLCERVFAPWTDMEKLLKEKGIGLFSLENKRELKDFDLLGFTLQYEMSYTTILNMLELGKIPIYSAKRSKNDPFVMAGGSTVFNSEPLAPFIDFFYIGEAEENLLEVIDSLKSWEKANLERNVILKKLSQLPGVYVPSLYEPSYTGQEFTGLKPISNGIKTKIKRQYIKDLNQAYCPTDYIVPYMEIVHNRAVIEVSRGCQRGCRFCAAGMTYRPTRERSVEKIIELADKTLASTGYDEIALASLSTIDHTKIKEILDQLTKRYDSSNISISLPSLRVDEFSVEMARNVQKIRKSGLTFAPEAGTDSLRQRINKGIKEEDLYKSVQAAFSYGWHRIKLYFMLGLPGETKDDLLGIAKMAKKVLEIGQKIRKNTDQRMKKIEVQVNVTTFIPKPFTPFQWVKMASLSEIKDKISFLQKHLRNKGINFDWNDPELSRLEGLIARGDRRMADVIYDVWQQGSRLEGWNENIYPERWFKALKKHDIEVESILGEKNPDRPLPWE
ncbi:MAG: TIGR03960 family B12-binding radical SAM protein, partial [Halarsenatibacteraceae bacterium]